MVWLLVKIIKMYQIVISPFIRSQCRFTPTCSQYAVIALQTHGIIKGLWMTLKRLSKCQPFYNESTTKLKDYNEVSSSPRCKNIV